MFLLCVVIQVLRVIDGDTIQANIPGWIPIVGQKIEIRLQGIDTPELRDKNPKIAEKAVAAKLRLKEILDTSKKVEIEEVQRDKYFRLLAKLKADGKDVSQMLLREKHARPYDGRKKVPWTE